MGVIIDLTPRLTLARRLRSLLKEVQFKSIRSAREYIKAIDHEIERQNNILCDRSADMQQVEEAIASLELLAELSRQRRLYLTQLEDEFNGYR